MVANISEQSVRDLFLEKKHAVRYSWWVSSESFSANNQDYVVVTVIVKKDPQGSLPQ